MAIWINQVTIAAPRNGSTTHSVDPSTGTVVTGTLFTPTAGNLLVCLAEGAVTSTTPAGWTLPSGGSAINNTGLYLWYRTAAGGDTFTTTHNGSNYPVVFSFYEFAAGSAFVSAAAATAVANTSSAGPTISGLTGTNLIMGVLGHGCGTDNTAASVAWGSGVEQVDTFVQNATTDGYLFSVAYLEDSVLTSTTMSTTVTITGTGSSNERLIFAVNVVSGGPLPAAIALRAAGTSTAIAATATTLNPAVPAGASPGDLSVLCVEAKPYTTTITTPSGWTKIGEATNGTTVSGIDTGSMKVAMYVKESAAVGAIGAITMATPDSSCAVIHTYSKDPGYTWDYSVFTTGSDTTQGTNYSATGGAIATTVGDWVVCATAVNTDLGTTAVSAQAIGGMSGDTLVGGVRTAGTADGQGLVTTGNDSRLIVVDAKVSAGSSAAAPTMAYTLAQTNSGTSIWTRLRMIPVQRIWRQPRTAIRRAANW